MIVSTTSSARSRRFAAALCAVLLWTACSEPDRAAPPGASGGERTQDASGATSQAGQSARGGGGSATLGGGSGDSGEHEAGTPSSEGGANSEGSSGRGGAIAGSSDAGGAAVTEPDVPIGVCAGTLRTDAGQRLNVSTTLADQLGGITPDELVIAWTTIESDTVQLLTAERADVEDTFGPPQVQVLAAALDRVALSPDGLRIVYVNADRRGFSNLSREAKGEPFAASEPFEYSLLNEADALPAGESYGDPVLSGSNLAFVYSRFDAQRSRSLLFTHRFSAQAPWPAGRELPISAEAAPSGAAGFQPTGLTADELTLFLWHPENTREYALQFDAKRLEFASYSELGALAGAVPNRDCTRVYYDSAGESSDLFVATRR